MLPRPLLSDKNPETTPLTALPPRSSPSKTKAQPPFTLPYRPFTFLALPLFRLCPLLAALTEATGHTLPSSKVARLAPSHYLLACLLVYSSLDLDNHPLPPPPLLLPHARPLVRPSSHT